MSTPRPLLLILLLAATLTTGAVGQETDRPDTVTVVSNTLTLRGLLWHPRGTGPFPAVLFNPGSYSSGDSRPVAHAQVIGPVFARHGYTFLALFRQGIGPSAGQGTADGDLMAQAFAREGQEGRNRVQLELLETEELNEAIAGLAFLRALPDVDPRRIAVAGHSFGGSLTLILAAQDTTLRGAVIFAGAARSWELSPELRARLLLAVSRIKAPVFLLHAANDYSVASGTALAAAMERLGKPHQLKVYPAVGRTPAEGHNFIFENVASWEGDVFAFLDRHLAY